MKISNQNINFKSTFPVQHWIAESAQGSYAPVANIELVKRMQGKLVRILNKSIAESNKPMDSSEQKTRAYIGLCDLDYRNSGKVRSFYNREKSGINYYEPIAYIISGKDIEPFENTLAKAIGKEKSCAKEILSNPYSPEALQAIKTYNINGLEYVNNPNLRIKNRKGMTYVLHTKFEIIRNKLGKIKDYRFVDARFLPEFGPENPFVKIGLK